MVPVRPKTFIHSLWTPQTTSKFRTTWHRRALICITTLVKLSESATSPKSNFCLPNTTLMRFTRKRLTVNVPFSVPPRNWTASSVEQLQLICSQILFSCSTTSLIQSITWPIWTQVIVRDSGNYTMQFTHPTPTLKVRAMFMPHTRSTTCQDWENSLICKALQSVKCSVLWTTCTGPIFLGLS